MTYKKGISVTSLVFVFLFGIVFSSCQQGQRESYKIGAVFTLTGDISYWSEQIQKGMELAFEEVNTPDKVPVEAIYEDVQGESQKAVSVFRKLSNVNNVSVAVSVFTPIGQPLRPLAKSSKTPLLATITSARNFAKGRKWSFRDYLLQTQMAPAIAEYATSELDINVASSLVVNDDYGLDGAKEFRAAFEENGGTMYTEETFEQQAADIRSQAAKVIKRNPGAVFVVGRDRSLASAIRQIRELGYEGRILSVNCLDQPNVWEQTGDAVNGAVFASAYIDYESKAGKQFRKKYMAKYGESPDHVNVYGYTIAKYLTSILREAEGNRAEVRKLLEKLKTESIRGELVMSKKHNVITPIAIYKMENGSKKLVEKPKSERE